MGRILDEISREIESSTLKQLAKRNLSGIVGQIK